MDDESAAFNSLRLTPAGHLRPCTVEVGDAAPAVRHALDSFRSDDAAGLFELAAHPVSGGLPPLLAYWRDFDGRYLTARCHTPAGTTEMEPVSPAGGNRHDASTAQRPPMSGAEYLTTEVLSKLWNSLDDWVRREASAASGLEAFLKSRALQEFAGQRNRKALVHLLTPVQRAAEKSPLIRELVESNDIYHPLAWTPKEAYRFLQEIPVYEESGVLVRVPDWWARRPRPQVAVRIGSKSRGMLGKDALLDFRVGITLGDTTLTEKEWKDLLEGEDGLVFLKGRWVEVHRERLTEALAH